MKENVIIDAGVLALHSIDDPRVKKYFDEIYEKRVEGFICAVNLAEYYYRVCEKLGKQTADTRYYQVRMALKVVETDEELTRTAGLERCRQPYDLSLADCFALALTKKLKGLLLTTDSELQKVKEINVKFFKV